MTTRVVQWATGVTGRMALRAVIEADDLELVGVRVYDRDKIGKDAGELAGVAATGVRAVDSLEAVLALKPDLVLYMGRVEMDPDGCFGDVAALLKAGIDVVATGSSFIDVRAFDPERGDALEAACRAGGGSFIGVGLYPGFWGEAVGPLLSRLSFKCNQITVRESLSYAGYDSAQMLFDVMGYGRPPQSQAAVLAQPSRPSPFACTASIIAKALSLKVDEIRPFRETAVTDKELRIPAGVVAAGTVAAQKIGVRARCGETTIVVEHVTWLGPDVKPEWSGAEGYFIELDGAPSLRCSLLLGTKGEDHTDMGCLATAMHAVHAIPVVLAAEPGLLDLADVPAFLGRIR
jgi:hypothetical protein